MNSCLPVHVHVTHQVVGFFMYIQEGFTPVHNAIQEGHDGIVEILLQAGASVDLQTKVRINFDPKITIKGDLTFQRKHDPKL